VGLLHASDVLDQQSNHGSIPLVEPASTRAQALSAAVEAWLSKHGRRPGMGSSSSGGLWHDPSYRGDINCWVTPAELTAAGQPLLAACLDMLSGLRTQLAAQG
jgi:hypothetical protein